MGTDVLQGRPWTAPRTRPAGGWRGLAVVVDREPVRRVPRRRGWPIGRGILVVTLAACLGWGLTGGAGADSAPTSVVSVVVRPGDTLWSIAEGHPDGGDIRTEVAEILALNRLSSPIIQPGETLVVPGS